MLILFVALGFLFVLELNVLVNELYKSSLGIVFFTIIAAIIKIGITSEQICQ